MTSSSLFFVAVSLLSLHQCFGVGGSFEVRLKSSVPAVVNVCLKEYQYSIVRDGRCVLGRTETTLIPEQMKVLRIPFQGMWPENISLIIDAANGKQESVGSLAWRGAVGGGEDWVTAVSSSEFLTVSYRYTCQTNFYGSQCSKMCIATDNLAGHFKCGSEGQKICLKGWSGDDCDSPVCESGCGNGNCTSPGVCKCPFGFTGPSCDVCMPHRDCMHGTCLNNKPGTCVCHSDWTGHFCDQDRHYCTRHSPCQNGGTCTNGRLNRRQKRGVEYTCTCPNGYGGNNCEINLIEHICENNEVCYNGGKCSMMPGNSSRCECAPGFKGDRCQLDLSKSPFSAVDACESNPCRNGAECQSINSLPVCTCAPCFSGPLCNSVDETCLVKRVNPSRVTVAGASDHDGKYAYSVLLGILSLIVVLACVLLGLILLYRKMKNLVKDPNTQNAVNSRRSSRLVENMQTAKVYQICVDDSCKDAPPPYFESQYTVRAAADNSGRESVSRSFRIEPDRKFEPDVVVV